MPIRLLFITSHYFYPLTMDALRRLNPDCMTTVVAYDDFSHIPEIYRQYENQCDAVLISGASAKWVLKQSCPNIEKPITSFQVDSDALHRDILRLAVEQKSLDFSRIAMDFLLPMEIGYSVADFLEIQDMLSVINSNRDWMMQTQILETGAEQLILNRITELWNQKAIDCVICMYSSNIPKLQQLGIPFRCPFLSDAHLKRLIKKTLTIIELKQLHNNHPAIIQIFPTQHAAISKAESDDLEKSIQEFVRTNMIDAVIQNSPSCCTLITTMQVALFLTHSFQTCRIRNFLSERLPFPVVSAYGIGTTVTHAMNNVQLASREAKILELPFAVDSNGNLHGPMDSDSSMIITQASLIKLDEIARRARLSSMTVQRIISVLHRRSSDKITVQELANGMNTTLRNANRIMNNLQNAGFAVPVFTQATHSRGRPIRVYMIQFPRIT